MIFITFKIRDKTCLKIRKTWFVLVYWVAKNSKLISLCHFHDKKFEEKMTILKNAISLVNSCFLATREIRSLHITFIFFLL